MFPRLLAVFLLALAACDGATGPGPQAVVVQSQAPGMITGTWVYDEVADRTRLRCLFVLSLSAVGDTEARWLGGELMVAGLSSQLTVAEIGEALGATTFTGGFSASFQWTRAVTTEEGYGSGVSLRYDDGTGKVASVAGTTACLPPAAM